MSIPELESVARVILDHLDWHGLACLKYVRDVETVEYTLFEINPRMWQSTAATVRMGADFPRYYWLLASDEPGAIDSSYDVGVGCHWLKGELLHTLSLFRSDSPHVNRPGVLSTLGEIVSPCVKHPLFDLLTLDDPGPFVQDWWGLLEFFPVTARWQLPGGHSLSADRHYLSDDQQREGSSVGISHSDELKPLP